MNRLFSVTLLLPTCLLTSASAQRVDNRVLYQQAIKFREAVVQFERVVVSVRGIQRSDERIVDRFEEATKRVVLAARNPRQRTKLNTEYRKLLQLQDATVKAIFEGYTPNRGLLQAWDQVVFFQYNLEEEMAFHSEFPRHQNRVRKRIVPTTQAVSNR